MDIELRIDEWYIISRGQNQYNKAIFDDVHKISMVNEEFFQTEENKEQAKEGRAEEKYTISRYEFIHVSKKECEKREKLIKDIHHNEKTYRKKDKQLVKQIEAIDDELGISYHDGKYGEHP